MYSAINCTEQQYQQMGTNIRDQEQWEEAEDFQVQGALPFSIAVQ